MHWETKKLCSLPYCEICFIVMVYNSAVSPRYSCTEGHMTAIIIDKPLPITSIKNKQNQIFSFAFTYSFSDALPVFMWTKVSKLDAISFSLKHFFSHFLQVSPLTSSSLNFCLSEKVFFSLHFERAKVSRCLHLALWFLRLRWRWYAAYIS